MTVYLVNGWNVRDGGANTVRKMEPYLDELGVEYEVIGYKSNIMHLLTLSFINKKVVKKILKKVKPGDKIICHSNGAWVSVQAAELGAPIDHLICVQPALHVNHEFPRHIRRIDVVYNEGDKAVLAGRVWRWTTRLMPWRWFKPHGWGAMGRYGYKGDDDRVVQHEIDESYEHSGFWHDRDGTEDDELRCKIAKIAATA